MVTDLDIRRLAERIAAAFHPEKIVLFGSRASKTHREDSDVDLLIVLRYSGRPLKKAVEILDAADPRFAVDLILRTPEEVEWRYEQFDPVIREALDHGVVLYEAAA